MSDYCTRNLPPFTWDPTDGHQCFHGFLRICPKAPTPAPRKAPSHATVARQRAIGQLSDTDQQDYKELSQLGLSSREYSRQLALRKLERSTH